MTVAVHTCMPTAYPLNSQPFTYCLSLVALQEAYLRHLLQRHQYGAAAVQMRMAVHLAGFALPGLS